MSPSERKRVRKIGVLSAIRQDKGFGFITARDSNEQYFVHIREADKSAWFLNASVSFFPGKQTDTKKAPRAFDVRLSVGDQ
jgi:cold shock CspA family protein